MHAFLHLKKSLFITSVLTLLFLSYGCQKKYEPPGELNVNSIFITQTHHTQYLDLPSGAFSPDNPNFHINNPATWTGNMAQYVIHRYWYQVDCHITNSGKGTGYDAELDIGYFFDDGSDDFETLQVGSIPSYGEKMITVEIMAYQKQLEECAAEVYWFNY